MIKIIEFIFTSSVLIILLIICRFLFFKKIKPVIIYNLWILVFIKLLFPFSLPSYSSVLNFFKFENKIFQKQYLDNYLNNIEFSNVPTYKNLNMVYNDIFDNLPYNSYFNNTNKINILFYIYFTVVVFLFSILIINNINFYLKAKNNRKYLFKIDNIKVYQLEILDSPALIGLFKPIIYLNCYENEKNILKYIFDHELCHRKYKDNFICFLRIIVTILHWYNPLVLLFSYFNKQDCELACDYRVIKNYSHNERVEYGKTILSIISKKNLLFNISTNLSTSIIKKRIVYIANKKKYLKIFEIILFIFLFFVTIITFTNRNNVYKFTGEKIYNFNKRGLVLNNYPKNKYEEIAFKSMRNEVMGDYVKQKEIYYNDGTEKNYYDIVQNNYDKNDIEPYFIEIDYFSTMTYEEFNKYYNFFSDIDLDDLYKDSIIVNIIYFENLKSISNRDTSVASKFFIINNFLITNSFCHPNFFKNLVYKNEFFKIDFPITLVDKIFIVENTNKISIYNKKTFDKKMGGLLFEIIQVKKNNLNNIVYENIIALDRKFIYLFEKFQDINEQSDFDTKNDYYNTSYNLEFNMIKYFFTLNDN